ncbi:hypothetical protein [Natrinema gari]|uniref:PH domain-containing protein n=1 Tax=Natrinema gari JCM 14663 TaxID=1230459 RepID=L9ZC36_9EURY|nr:hypothetical protein [Natrinema gari]ELY83187.1 hypothetical protein C486_02443 [Natrinema gari JCM 14663]
MTGEVAFREVQRFRQWWLWVLLGLAGLVSVVAGGPVGLLIIGAIAVLFRSLRLVTEVRTDGLYVRFAPLHRSFRRVPWEAIDSVESVTYRPLREYGGWGIRWRPATIAFNVSGSRGVYVTRSDDRDLLVGSLRPDELATAIRDGMHEAEE